MRMSKTRQNSKAAKDVSQAVREICLWFPHSEEVRRHGMPDFRVEGKTFATYVINHHGDGHLALWLRAPPGAQSLYVDAEPEHFYVPPYVGPKGWLGVDLDQDLSWLRIADLVREAYAEVAPKRLTAELGPTIEITAPTMTIDPEVFDPFCSAKAQDRLQQISEICLRLPETSAAKQFGNPCFKAGKKNFCTLYFSAGCLQLSVWAGKDAQATLTFDTRYQIPMYTGHNGWLNLDIDKDLLHDEAVALIHDSYRHFALKRMLKALDGLV